MTPKVYIFVISWNEAVMMNFFLRHYSTFAEKIIIFDEMSTDGTRELVQACPKAELRKWPWRGLDDNRFVEAVNNWYKEARGKADWCAWVDPDELLYHPEPLKVLAASPHDIEPAIGYALISRNGMPKGDGQIYDQVRTGIRQTNYDKALLWRPEIEMQHTIGRHTYPGQWPKHNGKMSPDAKFKLLHCHHVGGVEFTEMRNRRNYGRAVDKKFAWNFAAEHNSNPKQSGSVAWVKAAIEENKLIDVFGLDVPLKIHLGCGGHKLEGWLNHDAEVDITKPLPFADGSASHIFAEHVLEHVTHQQAWTFFEECFRVLRPSGVIRIAIPDFCRLQRDITEEYQAAVKTGGHGDGTKKAALRAMVFEHGHQATWNGALLQAFMLAIGFKASPCDYGASIHPELNNIEQHWKTVGRGVAEVETSIAEGTKP